MARSLAAATLQRHCSTKGPVSPQRECTDCRGHRHDPEAVSGLPPGVLAGQDLRGYPSTVQRSAGDDAYDSVPDGALAVLSRSGRPLDAGLGADLGARLGHDFAAVRVHDSSEAASAAASVAASAYTVGSDIVFGRGQYQPGTPAGRRLLTHELTHVVQQGSGRVPAVSRPTVGAADSPLEREADRVADAVAAGRRVDPGGRGSRTAAAPIQLDTVTRAFFEPRFGHHLSQVRVHPGANAAKSARAVNALTYTLGRDVVFGAGQYAPQAGAGRKLLAHELTHTLQQSSGARPAAARLQRTLGDGHDLQSPRFAGDLVLEACFDNQRLLQSGAAGPAVRKLQQALIDAGFPLPLFGVDGLFKSETQTAVRNYQQAHGLGVDGIVGPITMGELDTQFAAGPAPAPPGPAPAPAPPAPAPAPGTITSQTVATSPGLRTRTTIGVGEQVTLTHSLGTAATAWVATAGTFLPPAVATGAVVKFAAPDTAQTVTITASGVTITLTIVAPTGVHMDRFPGSGVKHTLNRADVGIQTQPFLLPDTVNLGKVIYHELDVAGTTAAPFPCGLPPGHCGVGGGGAACGDLPMTAAVVAGKGTQSAQSDCAFMGSCGTTPPFTPVVFTIAIPYEYKVGTGPFHAFRTVNQVHALLADASTLTADKAGAHGDTTVASPTSTAGPC